METISRKYPKMTLREKIAFRKILAAIRIEDDVDNVIAAISKRLVLGRWKVAVSLDAHDHFIGWDIYEGERYVTHVEKKEAEEGKNL